MEKQTDIRQAVWSRYWSHGVGHSCGGSYGSSYEGALAAWWRAAFATLAPGARVLDIATGNGALPRLLLDFDQAGTLSCDAVDLATLAPAWFAGLAPERAARLRFHGKQAAEALPFPDGNFDLVMSQYGLEYTDLARTVPEILRVLAPGGRIRLLTHHADARPVVLAATELDHMAWMALPGGLLETATALLEPLSRAATEAGRATLEHDQAAIALRTRFNQLQPEVTQLASKSNCPDVLVETRQAIGAIINLALNQGYSLAAESMQKLRLDLTDAKVRLQELRDYALDQAGVEALCAALARGAVKAEFAPIQDQSELMGWIVAIDRA
ncbi:MAG: class I SAM-dependent methyltransferase [Pseudomonadota bacterium]